MLDLAEKPARLRKTIKAAARPSVVAPLSRTLGESASDPPSKRSNELLDFFVEAGLAWLQAELLESLFRQIDDH
jgi:hypothetical protein